MAESTRRRSLVSRGALQALLVLFVSLACACTTVAERADRAYEAQNYEQAYQLYQQAIDEGTKEPQVYLRAARASIHMGNFAAAERLFSNALRHGGGREAARELANFYVRTSNYANAVRVYQFLLHEEADPQPVYNNLGTALMYAGTPLDAESYLMVAQQLDPEDPLPYLNLGVLYDEHLRQPWLAMAFYSCFLELGGPAEERQRVRQRFAELEARWQRQYDPAAVTCGEGYRPRKQGQVDLRAELSGEGASGSDISAALGQEPADDSPREGEEDEGRTIVIERQVTEPVAPAAPAEPVAAAKAGADARARASEAFDAGDYAAVVAGLSELPLNSLDAADMRRLGIALVQLGRADEAASWLEMSISREPSPQAVRWLVTAFDRSGKTERVVALCRKYNGREGYRDALASCPALVSPEVIEGKIVVPR